MITRIAIVVSAGVFALACSSSTSSSSSSSGTSGGTSGGNGGATFSCGSATCDSTKQYCQLTPDAQGNLQPAGCQNLVASCTDPSTVCGCMGTALCPTTGTIVQHCSTDSNNAVTFGCAATN